MTGDEHATRSPQYKHSTRYVLGFLAVASVVLWLMPDMYAWLSRKPDKAWVRVQQSGVIKFAIDPSYMPFDGLGSHGDFFGIDVDLANEIAKRIGGVRAEFVVTSYDSEYDVLKVGQADATISALVTDPSRLDKWRYSTPYFDAGQVLIAPTNAAKVSSPSPGGQRISAEYGSAGDAEARHIARRTAGVEIVYADTTEGALRKVLDGQADEAIVDAVSAAQLLPQLSGLHQVEYLTHDPYAIAVWGGSVELLNAINAALNSMQQDGTTQRIVDEWMKR